MKKNYFQKKKSKVGDENYDENNKNIKKLVGRFEKNFIQIARQLTNSQSQRYE